jgi:hypothetical protein
VNGSSQQEQRSSKAALGLPVWLLIVAALCTLVVLLAPLWLDIRGHDGLYHRNWIAQFTQQFRDGNIYPRWMAASFSGFGSPVFYYYPPLAYHVAGLVSLLGITDTDALFKIVGFIFLVLSFFTCRQYLKSITTNSAAITIGAFLYAITPYRFLDLYIRSAWSEYVALTWVPLIFLVAEKLVASEWPLDRIRNTVLMGGLTALIIVTNIPTTIIILPAVVVYMLCIAPVRQYGRIILASTMAAVSGVVFAGVFTFPLYAFRDQMREDSLWQFFQSSYIGYSLDTAFTPNNRVFGVAILAVIAIAIVAAILLIRLRSKSADTFEKRRMLAFIMLLLGALFLQIPAISEPVYHIPFLRYIQFSFRWDIVICLALSGAVALFVIHTRKYAYLVTSAMLISSVFIIIGVTARFGSRPAIEHVRVIEHDDPAEYLSIHAQRDPLVLESYFRHKSEFVYDSVSGFHSKAPSITIVKRIPEEHVYHVIASDTGTIAINLQHFPSWQVMRNGESISSAADAYGRRLIQLTPGAYEVIVQRVTTSAEKYGLYATTIGVLAVGLALLHSRKRRAKGS